MATATAATAEMAIAFPAHLVDMYRQTVSAHLKHSRTDIRLMTEGDSMEVILNKTDHWFVLTFKDLPERCAAAARAFVKKMDCRFVLFARVDVNGKIENIAGQFTPIFFEAKTSEPALGRWRSDIQFRIEGIGFR